MIETTVALVVTAMGLALLAGIGSNMQKQVVAKQEIDQFEWERFVSLLQNERQHFALVKKPGENVENIYLYSRKAKKDYIVHYESERDKVIMETASGGYMPLLYRVSSFRAIKQGETIKITAQIDQRTYQTTLSLPLQKECGL
ncbi:competence type IV pilus minor pilin ComGF [Lactobacillus sp. AN1001]